MPHVVELQLALLLELPNPCLAVQEPRMMMYGIALLQVVVLQQLQLSQLVVQVEFRI